MTYDVRETPAEIISRALSCAEGEAAIDAVDERAARAWLAQIRTAAQTVPTVDAMRALDGRPCFRCGGRGYEGYEQREIVCYRCNGTQVEPPVADRVIAAHALLAQRCAAAEARATESDARIRAYETFIRWLGDSWRTGFTYMGDTAVQKHRERHGSFASREDMASWTIAWREEQIQRYVKPAMDALAASDTQPNGAEEKRSVIAAQRKWQHAWDAVQGARLRAQFVTPQAENALYQASCELDDAIDTDDAAKEGG